MSSLTKLLQEKRNEPSPVPINNKNTTKSSPLLHTTSRTLGLEHDRNVRNPTTSVTTVTQLDSEDDTETTGSSTASSSVNDKNNVLSSSFLTANFAHTATLYGTSLQSRDLHQGSGSFIDNSYLGSNDIPARKSSMRSSNSARPIPSLSSSIPYSVPNSNKDASNTNIRPMGLNSANSSYSSSWLEQYGSNMPSNISAIDSTVISSPKVDSVEARFVISKQKLQKASMSITHTTSVSRSNSFSSQIGSLFSKGSRDKYAANTATNETRSHSSTSTNSNSTAATAIPKPGRARQSSIYSSSRQPSGSYTENFYGSPSSMNDHPPSQSVPRSHHSSIANLRGFFFKKSSGNLSTSINATASNLSNSPGISSNISAVSNKQPFTPGSYNSVNSDTIYSATNEVSQPFSKRYFRTGEDLGAGAGGSVKLVKRLSDSKILAVKEFRLKFENETKRDYVKKITSEYCIGTTLHHQNIIETVEIVYDNNRMLQVMEYCDYDLFAIVMSDKMSYEETCCCFKQILTGVEYLHSIGLAHRDLKLDNCVINSKGIVKLIDFGAAVVFSYPFSKNLVEASGIVGSDPYLAPEVCIFTKYDPRPVDIWSVAIIFACMILKKFPWKIPKLRDSSFKLFCSGRDCDSLSSLVTRTPNPPSYDNISADSKPVSSNNASDPNNLNIGPQRLLHQLPEESQHIIGRMIDLAPACRSSIDEVMKDPWITSIEMCHQVEDGLKYKLVSSSDHTHTKVDQSEAHIAGLEKKKKKQQRQQK
ncbi:hypothetical protein KAFR_0A07560 [Kazachstania africana CBS 2517]|uniref:non-specific serine/threonine protein kinase n=1 Tax=Kazachstania africana (strain ATCC 22294 / BCRC 22015 / CBS 2517 / CECT 1963 / NBRC 1671 / NRRL Y-8276) TaxID=1071382 RepID=H2AP90_KAZAF|nr:hypothetical protein KAFR_0A07560 [Kazachstania africana CBS 2517]CCF56190.1 hypothetical protein KAFR_0A07560 [Kazachstania africana CBS 2517]